MCEFVSGVIFRLVFANQVCGLGPLLSGDILVLQEGECEGAVKLLQRRPLHAASEKLVEQLRKH